MKEGKTTMTEKCYKIGQAAEYVGCAVFTLQKYDRQGIFKAHRTRTNQRYYTKEQLDQFIKDYRTGDYKPNHAFVKYAKAIPAEKMIGRDQQSKSVLQAIKNNRSIIILSKHTGDGKKSFVRNLANLDRSRNYYSVNLKDLADDCTIAGKINTDLFTKQLMSIYDNVANKKRSSVIVFDNFHQIILYDPYVIVPLYHEIINQRVATIMLDTYENFRKYLTINTRFVERLCCYNLPQLDKDSIIKILKQQAKKYNIENIDNEVYEYLYNICIIKWGYDRILKHNLDLFNAVVFVYQLIGKVINPKIVKKIDVEFVNNVLEKQEKTQEN